MLPVHLLYPSDPIDSKLVDDIYRDEHDAACAAGLPVSLFSFEDLGLGRFRPSPVPHDGETILYRGWMLPVSGYEQLVYGIERYNATASTSVEHYRLCHHLPGWYPLLREFTAETIILPRDADFRKALAGLSWPGYFIKDYVKSLSTGDGSLVDTPEEIGWVVDLMEQYRGTVEGGVCVRRREEYVPGSEQRFFVFCGNPFSAHGTVPPIVAECARRIESPFFSVDIALRVDGVQRVIELGDGQVSDRKEWAPQRLIEVLAHDG